MTVPGRLRRESPSSWRRWVPRKPWGAARGVTSSASSNHKFDSWRRNGRRHLTLAEIQRNHSPGKHAHEQAEKTLDEKKKPSMDISPPLDDDDASTLWSADEPGPKQMSNTRGRIRRFLRLHRHRRREASETGADADAEQTSSSSRSKKTQKTPAEEQRHVADKDGDGSTLGWRYNLAAGLAWYLPAPFDMMPQGYPSRVF